MGLFDKLFRRKMNISEEKTEPNNVPRSEKCREIYNLKDKYCNNYNQRGKKCQIQLEKNLG